ncbi:hypothetical protein CASFOL_006170 [Castilleja foliolosa]|uniref:Rab-GAP TBC domain-containing protein n=1 Tax=Castilleja foliolosa TaxID=1961234 RepID=A0ABD3E659_9LAMI
MKAKAAAAAAVLNPAPVISFDHKRDAYGFAVRPQHLQRYREYANIYKEEEEERSDRWDNFLERQCESALLAVNGLSDDNNAKKSNILPTNSATTSNDVSVCEDYKEVTETKVHQIQIWSEIRSSLRGVEDMMSSRAKKRVNLLNNAPEPRASLKKQLSTIEEPEDSEEEFYDLERSESDPNLDNLPTEGIPNLEAHSEYQPPWRQELECLVQGGVPMALRGELWQAFVGVRARREENYYQNLLASDTNTETRNMESVDKNHNSNVESVSVPEKWKAQIEKDLPRTFPGHPALDEDGRNALRRLLTAYARHNPSVGYCQAMNFFAGLLLLLMPEENAFWALLGILDDYFDGYYSEEMIESQVDQLVLEELVREKFPKLGYKPSGLPRSAGGMGDRSLVPHNIYEYASMGKRSKSLGRASLRRDSCNVISDCTCFNGVIRMTLIFAQFCAGPALVTTKDAGDAITLLQSLAGSTFDSSQLVLTACMGFQNIQEARLQELRNKHRPAVRAVLDERSNGARALKDSQGLASKLYSFKKDPGSVMIGTDKSEQRDMQMNGDVSHLDPSSVNVNELYLGLNGNVEIGSAKDLEEQVVWLKVELCRLLEDKRSSELRAEELETALMEMVKQDNRRQLSARVEQLEQHVGELKQALADKQEQESAMLQILMRVEQEQKVTEDARIFAEQDAAAQRYAAQVLQEKYEEASAALSEMEKRAVMAESMLEATLQYQSGQNKAQPSPRSMQQSNQDHSQEIPARKISLLSRPFGLGWRDKNKGKPANGEETNDGKQLNEGENISLKQEETNGHRVEEV